MGYPSTDLAMSFNEAKLEKLLRHAKVTQQSIQTVSTWILERRAYLNEIVDVWVRLLKSSEAHHQIVFLYVANDTMQVGVRKYGKHIAEMFECKLLEIVEYVMKDGEEKVKRCVIKIIGIWKERNTVNAALLEMLQNVCAGRPALPEGVVKEVISDDEQVRTAHEKFLQEIESDAGEETALAEMTEVAESEATAVMAQRLQDLVSATISADLLSDRMFQLESSLSTFHHATEAYEAAEVDMEAESKEEEEPKSAGDLVWEMLDQQVFDVDVDKSREHVELYRANLEAQNAKRDELVSHLESLALLDPFSEPTFHTSQLLRDQQAESLERLYVVCLKAEIVEKQREAERQALYKSRPPMIPTSASPRRSSSGTTTPRGSATSYSDGRYRSSGSRESPFQQHHSPGRRRYSGSEVRDDSRYGSRGASDDGDGYYSKRPKLQHSQSLDDSRRPSSSRKWDQSPRGFQENYHHSDRYQDPSPRHQQYPTNGNDSHGSRWDTYPQQDGRRDHSRRW